MAKQFVVLGAGAWGTALASHLASNKDHVVTLWGHDPSHIAKLQQSHINQEFLPDVSLPENLKFSSSLEKIFGAVSLQGCIVLMVVPSFAFEETLKKLKPFSNKILGILWGTKGLSSNGAFLHTLCAEILPNQPIGILAGPSFAKEVAVSLPTAVTIATSDVNFGRECMEAFHTGVFRVYLSEDLIGAELGGVIKNVLAIAVGMCDGLGFGANARAALITRGMQECQRLGQAFAMRHGTLMSMACLGDIVLTCTDNQSRNRRFGVLLGQGKTVEGAEAIISHVVEGKTNVRQLMALAKAHDVDLPICEQVFKIIYEGLKPQESLHELLSRSPKRESE